MPPLSQGLALNSQTLSALSLILAVPKVIASAGSEMYQDRMLSASLLQPGAVNVKSRRGFLKFCGTCTTCRRNVKKMVCKCIGEDPQCSSAFLSASNKVSKALDESPCSSRFFEHSVVFVSAYMASAILFLIEISGLKNTL